MSASVAVLIDYQNIHLTARDAFAPAGLPAHESLVHPVLFAEKVCEVRAELQGEDCHLEQVRIYRGRPSNQRQATLYAANQAQAAEWTRDKRVVMWQRTLRYDRDGVIREKGVDVMVALDYVRLAKSGEFGVVILASHDTDLEPALEMAMDGHRARIETAGWDGCKRIRPDKGRLWHTFLKGTHYVDVRDRKRYIQ